MAFTSAQLASAITAGQLQFNLTNVVGTGLPPVAGTPLSMGYPVQIDSEMMFVVSQPVLNTVIVRGRGSDGTAPSAHDILANVYVGPIAGDFPLPQPGTLVTTDFAEDSPVTIGQDSTLVLPGANAVYNINKASAAAIVVPAPTVVDNGVSYAFTSNTAFAHVLTMTSLINDGTTSVPKSTATFTAAKGASVTFVVENGLFNVLGTPLGVTFT